MPPRPYRLAFYLDARGDSPVERWLEELDPVAAYALGSAMAGLLLQSGPLLCVLRPQYASSLGGGLYEFRFQDLTEDLLRQLGKKARGACSSPRRRFCSASSSIPTATRSSCSRRLRQGQAFELDLPECPDPDRTKALGGLAGPAPPTPEVARLDLAMHKAHNENMAKTWNQFMKGLQARAKAGGAEHVRTLRALRSHYRRMGQELAEERKKLGMSQERLAKTTGIDQAEIS